MSEVFFQSITSNGTQHVESHCHNEISIITDDDRTASCDCCGQDCLLQWLQHSGKEACELCKHKFQFKPVYAEDAPTDISTTQVRPHDGWS